MKICAVTMVCATAIKKRAFSKRDFIIQPVDYLIAHCSPLFSNSYMM